VTRNRSVGLVLWMSATVVACSGSASYRARTSARPLADSGGGMAEAGGGGGDADGYAGDDGGATADLGAATGTAPAAAPAATATTIASGMTIAGTDGAAETRPAPGQLTAGVWDDNQNFDFFEVYATRLQAGSRDLAAFTSAEQRAAHAQLAQPSAHARLDVQLVIDTTGSMGDELAYLQSELDSIADQVHARFPKLTPRWSLVLYRDHGDQYVTRKFDFTTDLAAFRANLAKQAASGGGDFPEAVIDGLGDGLAQSWRDTADVARMVFWVADAPPHPGEGGDLATLARAAASRGIHIYPIASSGIDDATEYQMRATAQLTGGRYLFLTDDSGIGDAHAEPTIPCYAVTHLDQAVIRMIETEVTGARVEVAAEDVVRRVGSPDDAGRCKAGSTMVVAF